MIRNDDYFEIIKEQNKELAKFRPFKSAYEMKKEIERLNNIIKRLEEDLKEMYLTFGEFNEEYTENRIKELKGESNEED
jgi:hypothetical protein